MFNLNFYVSYLNTYINLIKFGNKNLIGTYDKNIS